MLKTLNSSNSVTLSALLVFFLRKKKLQKKKKKKKKALIFSFLRLTVTVLDTILESKSMFSWFYGLCGKPTEPRKEWHGG